MSVSPLTFHRQKNNPSPPPRFSRGFCLFDEISEKVWNWDASGNTCPEVEDCVNDARRPAQARRAPAAGRRPVLRLLLVGLPGARSEVVPPEEASRGAAEERQVAAALPPYLSPSPPRPLPSRRGLLLFRGWWKW